MESFLEAEAPTFDRINLTPPPASFFFYKKKCWWENVGEVRNWWSSHLSVIVLAESAPGAICPPAPIINFIIIIVIIVIIIIIIVIFSYIHTMCAA